MTYKKYIPHVIAIITFLIITYISFQPLFSNKTINQSDIIQHRGMSKELLDYRNTENTEALWTNSMFGGMPAYQISTLYPSNWVSKIDQLMHLYLPHPSGYIFMCFLGFFILLLCLEINPWLAFVGALGYGFSSYFFIILEVGHNSKANAISYLAPILGGLVLLMKGKKWLGFALVSLFMALELNANHVQITYYGFFIFLLVFASYFAKAVQEKKIKVYFIGVTLFMCATLIGFLPNAGSLLATNEYGNYSTRGKTELTINSNLQSNKQDVTSGLDKSYALMYSHGIWETMTFLIPDFKGGASGYIGENHKDALKEVDPQIREQISGSSQYFGDQGGTAGPVYIGSIIIFLAVLGVIIIKHPLKWPLIIATLLSVMLSWGRFFEGFNHFFLDYVPGYNKFRAVSMILIIAELTLPLLAILAVDQLIKYYQKSESIELKLINKKIELKKIVIFTFLLVGGFCFLGALTPNIVNSFLAPGEEQKIIEMYKQSGVNEEQISQFLPTYLSNLEIARQAIFKSDAWRSALFITVAFICFLMYLMNVIKKELLFVLIGVCFIADQWPVSKRYLNEKKFISRAQFDAPPQKTAADEQILADNDPNFRVLNLSVGPFMDATTSYYHKSIGGYHGAKLKKYDELISFHLFKEMNFFSDNLRYVNNDSMLNAVTSKLNVLNMLNTKYIIWPTKENTVAIKNPQANGSAWLVESVKTVPTADSEIVALYNLDAKREAVIQSKNKDGVSLLSNYKIDGFIKLQSYKPNYLVYESDTKSKAFAVFSEIYYPKGWNAYVDGDKTPYVCVDYLLRGLELPSGKHKVEFKFEPEVYKTGSTIALFGSIILVFAVFLGGFLSYKNNEIYS